MSITPSGLPRMIWGGVVIIAIIIIGFALAGSRSDFRAPAARETVSVLYAGSLVHLMETEIGPAFQGQTGITFEGEGKGSVTGAVMIREGMRQPDVFISADPLVNFQELMSGSKGKSEWFLTFLANELVFVYDRGSRWVRDLDRAAAGEIPWYQALEGEGLRLGRTDPQLDPKGYRLFFLAELARRGNDPATGKAVDRLLAAPTFPEEHLMVLVETGQLDVAQGYRNEAVERGLPFIPLPAGLNQGDVARTAEYAQAAYTTDAGVRYRGTPILYTVTIPVDAPHPEAAARFIEFLLSGETDRFEGFGFNSAPVLVGGRRESVPEGLRDMIDGTIGIREGRIWIEASAAN